MKNKYRIIKFKYSEDSNDMYKLKIKRWWFPVWIGTEYLYNTYESAMKELKWLRRKPSSKIEEEGVI